MIYKHFIWAGFHVVVYQTKHIPSLLFLDVTLSSKLNLMDYSLMSLMMSHYEPNVFGFRMRSEFISNLLKWYPS